MSNTKQLPPFIFQLSDTVQLEINAKVDMEGMEIRKQEICELLCPYAHNLNMPVYSFNEGYYFYCDALVAKETELELTDILKEYPVKIHYNTNNVTMYVDFNQTKTVDIQTIFYQGFNVKELLLEAAPILINSISKQAIEEANKPETINHLA